MKLINVFDSEQSTLGTMCCIYETYIDSSIYCSYSDIHLESYGNKYMDSHWIDKVFI